ncbi:MAG TPA: ABC transporter substrate-binding protein [Chloroflexota bacterium]|nr:ABC transporter substrate-binding protein [Chloroflexota bacterium]
MVSLSRLWLVGALVVGIVLAACAPASAPSAPAASAPAPPASAPGGAPAPPAAAAAPRELTPLTVGRAAVRVTVAPLWLAQELGYFAEEGLAVDDQLLRSAPAVEAALVAGDLQIGFTGMATALTARAGGSEDVMTASYLDVALGELEVRPDIVQPADLRGRILGVQSIGGTVHIRGLLALQKLGLDVERDHIQVIQAGDDPTLAQGLIAGAIDAAPISYTSAAVARANGMHGWDLGELGVAESSVSVITTATIARERPALIESFLKGLARGVHYLKQGQTDAAKRDRALQVVAGKLQVAPDAVATELDKVAEYSRIDLVPDRAALTEFRAAVVRQAPEAERVSVDDLLDLSFVQKLDREGFFQQLAATP